MAALPAVHLAVMQPAGYVHALGFIDQARYLRWQFRRLGAGVTLAKNRLREDALNIVFGAHLGFPPEWRKRHACLFFNLEQLGDGGAATSADYLRLLHGSAVVDYDTANVAAYCADPADVPVVPLLHAPYLDDGRAAALEERPIDLLFFGSVNPRRRTFIERIERCGISVSMFDLPIYGEERDHFIRQAKAVVNFHFYDSVRFEQARASHCLSLGTPVISERGVATRPPAAFDDSVFWLAERAWEAFFSEKFATPDWYAAALAKLDAWRQHDPVEHYAELLAFGAGVFEGHGRSREIAPWRPSRINIGSGKDYRPGWLNLDVLDRAEPDMLLDLGRELPLPLRRPTRFGGTVLLEAGSVERIHASNVLEHVPDLPALMGNALALLKDGGEFHVEVPYEKALTAWQDPTHLRALNENSWLYYTDWFWYLGRFTHRFEIAESSWLDSDCKPCAQSAAAFMRVTLRKVQTTPHERTVARTMRADFGGLDEDWLPAQHATSAQAAATA